MADALVLGIALKIEGGEFHICSGSTDFCYKKTASNGKFKKNTNQKK